MIFEVEYKARLSNLAETEAQAAQLGVFEEETFKEDIYFRLRGDTSIVPANRYRLRQEAGRAIVTFKQATSKGAAYDTLQQGSVVSLTGSGEQGSGKEAPIQNPKSKIQNGFIEVNRETEFEVDDAYAFFQFADRFGFEPFVVKRKKSRVYRVGRAHVELNEVERLGHFVEIEILCEDENHVPVARVEIARLLNCLGIPANDLELRPYIRMIQEAHPVRYRFIDDRTLDWPFEEIL